MGNKISSFNSENMELNEGLIRFDIVFYVRMRDGISQMIINVEAQKDEPVNYALLNRAVFYVSRLISSQKERDFINTNYNDIKRVFSIWICMNKDENTMSYVHLKREDIIGASKWEEGLDLVNIVLIGLSDSLPEHDEKYDLHRLLGALLSKHLSVHEKLDIIEKEYNIPVEDGIRKDVDVMCNLSQGIIDDAKAEIIVNMYKKGYTLEQIADVTEKSVDEVKAIIEKKETVLS
ncbi:MAG: hypothetical protein ACI4HI_14485 [Lachnospiraceae bacterium]